MSEFISGFEAGAGGSSGGWATLGAVSWNTTTPRTGTYVLRAAPTGTGTASVQMQAPGSGSALSVSAPIATKFAFRVNTLPASGTEEIFSAPGGQIRIDS